MRRNEALRQRALHDLGYLDQLVDISADDDRLTIGEPTRHGPDLLPFAAEGVSPDHRDVLSAGVGPETGWQALDVAADAIALRAEQGAQLHAARILSQMVADRLESMLGHIDCHRICMVDDQSIRAGVRPSANRECKLTRMELRTLRI
jgi:hypothetical protein